MRIKINPFRIYKCIVWAYPMVINDNKNLSLVAHFLEIVKYNAHFEYCISKMYIICDRITYSYTKIFVANFFCCVQNIKNESIYEKNHINVLYSQQCVQLLWICVHVFFVGACMLDKNVISDTKSMTLTHSLTHVIMLSKSVLIANMKYNIIAYVSCVCRSFFVLVLFFLGFCKRKPVSVISIREKLLFISCVCVCVFVCAFVRVSIWIVKATYHIFIDA